MIKLIQFSGPCSFATFLATIGEGIIPAVMFVRGFENGLVACFIDISALADHERSMMNEAVRAANALEPVRLEHNVYMSPGLTTFITEQLSSTK